MAVITEPTVERIAHTSVNIPENIRLRNYMEPDEDSLLCLDVIEFAGRSCYQSFDKPNPATRANKDYIANIIEQGHESVLEHASVTYYIQGISRNCSHELVRHRHFSFSQQSQRFVDESEANIVLPPAFRESQARIAYDLDDTDGYIQGDLPEALEWWAQDSLWHYGKVVETLQEEGLPRKQAREAARSVLSGATETRIVITGNFRTWREFLWKRLAPGADAEIRQLAQVILEDLYNLAPAVFQDVWDAHPEVHNR